MNKDVLKKAIATTLSLTLFATHVGGADVFHIQDIHRNVEAQSDISKTIERLIEQEKVDLIALEGAFGPIDLSALRSFPHKPTLKETADILLKNHTLGGPIHALLRHPGKHRHPGEGRDPVVVGIDDRKLYEANVEAYQKSFNFQFSVSNQLSIDIDQLKTRKKRVFNKELLAFDSWVESYRQEEISLGAYAKRLFTEDVPLTVAPFLEALALEENLNLVKVEQERSKLLSTLLSRLNKSHTSRLLKLSSSFQNKEISHHDFYDALKILCEQSNITLTAYPEFQAYIQHILLAENVNPENLYQAIRDREQRIYQELVQSEEEERLIKKSRHLYLKGKLVEFALTPEEWKEYKRHIDRRSSFEEFYRLAEARDVAMSENLARAIEKFNAKNVVLVTGGFHAIDAPNLVKITPKVSKVDLESGTKYLSVFAQEKTPLDRLFDGNKLFLAEQPLPPNKSRLVALQMAGRAFLTKTVPLPTLIHWTKRFFGWVDVAFEKLDNARAAVVHKGIYSFKILVGLDGKTKLIALSTGVGLLGLAIALLPHHLMPLVLIGPLVVINYGVDWDKIKPTIISLIDPEKTKDENKRRLKSEISRIQAIIETRYREIFDELKTHDELTERNIREAFHRHKEELDKHHHQLRLHQTAFAPFVHPNMLDAVPAWFYTEDQTCGACNIVKDIIETVLLEHTWAKAGVEFLPVPGDSWAWAEHTYFKFKQGFRGLPISIAVDPTSGQHRGFEKFYVGSESLYTARINAHYGYHFPGQEDLALTSPRNMAAIGNAETEALMTYDELVAIVNNSPNEEDQLERWPSFINPALSHQQNIDRIIVMTNHYTGFIEERAEQEPDATDGEDFMVFTSILASLEEDLLFLESGQLALAEEDVYELSPLAVQIKAQIDMRQDTIENMDRLYGVLRRLQQRIKEELRRFLEDLSLEDDLREDTIRSTLRARIPHFEGLYRNYHLVYSAYQLLNPDGALELFRAHFHPDPTCDLCFTIEEAFHELKQEGNIPSSLPVKLQTLVVDVPYEIGHFYLAVAETAVDITSGQHDGFPKYFVGPAKEYKAQLTSYYSDFSNSKPHAIEKIITSSVNHAHFRETLLRALSPLIPLPYADEPLESKPPPTMEVIKHLLEDEKHREIITLRFGLDGNDPMTLQAISDRTGINLSSVYRIEKQALAILRSKFREAGIDGNELFGLMPWNPFAKAYREAETDEEKDAAAYKGGVFEELVLRFVIQEGFALVGLRVVGIVLFSVLFATIFHPKGFKNGKQTPVNLSWTDRGKLFLLSVAIGLFMSIPYLKPSPDFWSFLPLYFLTADFHGSFNRGARLRKGLLMMSSSDVGPYDAESQYPPPPHKRPDEEIEDLEIRFEGRRITLPVSKGAKDYFNELRGLDFDPLPSLLKELNRPEPLDTEDNLVFKYDLRDIILWDPASAGLRFFGKNRRAIKWILFNAYSPDIDLSWRDRHALTHQAHKLIFETLSEKFISKEQKIELVTLFFIWNLMLQRKLELAELELTGMEHPLPYKLLGEAEEAEVYLHQLLVFMLEKLFIDRGDPKDYLLQKLTDWGVADLGLQDVQDHHINSFYYTSQSNGSTWVKPNPDFSPLFPTTDEEQSHFGHQLDTVLALTDPTGDTKNRIDNDLWDKPIPTLLHETRDKHYTHLTGSFETFDYGTSSFPSSLDFQLKLIKAFLKNYGHTVFFKDPTDLTEPLIGWLRSLGRKPIRKDIYETLQEYLNGNDDQPLIDLLKISHEELEEAPYQIKNILTFWARLQANRLYLMNAEENNRAPIDIQLIFSDIAPLSSLVAYPKHKVFFRGELNHDMIRHTAVIYQEEESGELPTSLDHQAHVLRYALTTNLSLRPPEDASYAIKVRPEIKDFLHNAYPNQWDSPAHYTDRDERRRILTNTAPAFVAAQFSQYFVVTGDKPNDGNDDDSDGDFVQPLSPKDFNWSPTPQTPSLAFKVITKIKEFLGWPRPVGVGETFIITPQEVISVAPPIRSEKLHQIKPRTRRRKTGA